MAPGSVEEPMNGLSKFFVSPTRRKVQSTLPAYFASYHTLMYNLTTENFLHSHSDDKEERHEFGVSENVLNQGPPLHVGTVDEDEHT